MQSISSSHKTCASYHRFGHIDKYAFDVKMDDNGLPHFQLTFFCLYFLPLHSCLFCAASLFTNVRHWWYRSINDITWMKWNRKKLRECESKALSFVGGHWSNTHTQKLGENCQHNIDAHTLFGSSNNRSPNRISNESRHHTLIMCSARVNGKM